MVVTVKITRLGIANIIGRLQIFVETKYSELLFVHIVLVFA